MLESTIREINPSIIVHCAAISQVDFCEDNPLKCEVVNVIATQILVKISREMDSHFIFLSSDFVFDGEHPLNEESEICNPIIVYGKSKFVAESYIKANHLNLQLFAPYWFKVFPLAREEEIFSHGWLKIVNKEIQLM